MPNLQRMVRVLSRCAVEDFLGDLSAPGRHLWRSPDPEDGEDSDVCLKCADRRDDAEKICPGKARDVDPAAAVRAATNILREKVDDAIAGNIVIKVDMSESLSLPELRASIEEFADYEGEVTYTERALARLRSAHEQVGLGPFDPDALTDPSRRKDCLSALCLRIHSHAHSVPIAPFRETQHG